MKKSFILLHIAILLAGFTGIVGQLISLSDVFLVWYRTFFSCLALYTFLKITDRFRVYSRGENLRLGLTGLLPGLQWILFYASIRHSNVSVGVVCYCLTGFFTAIFQPLANRKKIDLSELLLSTITLAGIALIFHFDTAYRTGIALGALSSLFGCFYFMTNEKLVKRYDTKMINYYQMLGASLGIGCILPVYIHFVPVRHWLPSGTDMGYLLLLSICCTAGLYVLVAEALKQIPAFTVNLSFNLEPVYSIILAILLFKENKVLTGAFYAGLFLIILSIFLQMIRVVARHRRRT